MSLFDEVTQRFTAQVSNRVNSAIKGFSPASAGRAIATRAVGKFAPRAYDPFTKALNGDLLGAGLSALNQTGLGAKINGFLQNGDITGLLSESIGDRLYGGVTLSEARQIYAESQATNYARKNLFFIEIVDFDPRLGGASSGSHLFNMFATQVSVAPFTVSGDTKPIGAAQLDGVHSKERVELRLTTYDDAYGSIKRWFETRAMLATHQDGTFGVPADYLVRVRILHSAVNDEALARFGGYAQEFVMRPASLETELSRNEQGLQEIQLVFSQFDTFMF